MMKKQLALSLPLAASLLGTGCGEPSARPDQKYNIVYIVADDLGYGDLSCTGQQKFTTPNIDRMACEGMLFTQHYSGTTVSAPSRSCLMTGQHTGHTPIRGNREIGREGQLPLPEDTYTLGKMLQQAGYVTGAFGKWGLGYPGSEGDPTRQGFDEFFGYNCQREAHRYYPAHLWHNREKIVLEENTGGRKGQYAPDLIHQKAIEFIRQNKDKPFFLFLPYTLPHAEILVPEDEILQGKRGLYAEVPFDDPRPEAEYGPDMKTNLYCPQSEPYATFAAMITRLDKYVGEVLAELKKQGIDENTIVMFTSDNGPHQEGGANPDFFASYGPFRGVKRDLYEGGIHLPLIARCPGTIPGGKTSDHLCAFWDMMPTFADLAGVELPEQVQTDGISILPALKGEKGQKEHEYLYWEFHERGGKTALRKGNWKAVKLFDKDPGKIKFELYDLSEDIHEDHDLSKEYPQIAREMELLMEKAHTPSKKFPFVAD